MKTGEAENWMKLQLRKLYEEGESEQIASMVLEAVTGLDKTVRMTRREEPLNVHQLHHLTEIEQRLQQHEPVQYILGEAWFADMKLFVDKSVLIPRPETEELVEWIIKDVKAKGLNVFEKGATEADQTTMLKILDVGTGSGCIALALKKKMPKAEVWGCDISEEALNIARRNGSSLEIRVDFQGADFLDEAQHQLLPSVDIVVSNPPYVPEKDKETMHPNVLQYEPHTALFVPNDDTLIFYRALAQFGKKRLHHGGNIYMEIHESLGKEVADLFTAEGYKEIEIKTDMQGKERMVRATLT